MRIAIIGAGKVGTTLGLGWMRAGHTVVFGSRRPTGVPPAGAHLDSISSAAVSADAVVLATPWAAVEETVGALGDLQDKPLLDVTNPTAPGLVLALGHTTSGAERVASLASNARVVKAFNTTGLENMADPRYGERRVMMPLAGDDGGAVALAGRLATDLGFEPVALPRLSGARYLEPLAMLWIKLAAQWGHGRNIGFGLAKREAGDHRPRVAPSAQPRNITIVGVGNIGGALARAWLAAGHTVRLAVRDLSSPAVQELVAVGARAVPIAGSAAAAEVIVLATPGGVAVEAAKAMGDLKGHVVVDCTNAIAKGFTLQVGQTTSSSEELANALQGAKVVRAFNQQGAEVLRNPVFGGHRAANFVAADDGDARALVCALSNDVGLDSIQAGPLASSRLLEPMTLLWVSLAQALATREIGLSLMRR